MAFNNFSLQGACRAFSLKLEDERDLFGSVAEVSVSPFLRGILDEYVPLATLIHTEKARSEFIVAPILAEIRRQMGHRISLFSGIEFNVDSSIGLNGVCDFMISQSPVQLYLEAPVLTVVEAKNDNIRSGLGQCVAAMVAARLYNEREGRGPSTIFGAVTTGSLWTFLRLSGEEISVDLAEYHLDRLEKILAILFHCVGPVDQGSPGQVSKLKLPLDLRKQDMSFGKGLIVGHLITLRRFVRTFLVGHGRTWMRRGGGHQWVDFWFGPKERGARPIVRQDAGTEGLFTVEYPDERLPTFERSRVLPMLIYDEEDGHVRCTCCHICAKVCPPQCIWMTQAHRPDGKPIPLPADFYIDMDVCMNCGLCAEYCPFDAIKMDQNFELSNYERHQSHVFSLQDLLVSSEYYARTHPEAYQSTAEVAERAKVAKKKANRLQKGAASHPR